MQASPMLATAPLQVQFACVVGGCALAPDLDMAQSTIGRMWGPLTGGVYLRLFGKRRLILPGLSHLVEFLAGGHRRGTHSLDGLMILLLLVWLAQFWTIPTGFVVALVVGVAILALDFLIPGRVGWPVNLAVSAAAGYWAVHSGFHLPGWTCFAMALGCAVHILGDMLTIQGCPLVILGTRRQNVRILPLTTGGPVERLVIAPALIVWIFWGLALRFAPGFPTPFEVWHRTGWSPLWPILLLTAIVAVAWAWATGFDERRKVQRKRTAKKRKGDRTPVPDTSS